MVPTAAPAVPTMPAPPPGSRTRPAAPRTSVGRPLTSAPLDASTPSEPPKAPPAKCSEGGAYPEGPTRTSSTESEAMPELQVGQAEESEENGEEEELVPKIDPEALKIEDEVFGSNSLVEIFKAEYKGGPVTVKKLVKFGRMNLREQVQFSREMSALAKLNHPKLVRLLGVCLTTRPVQMVVEHCPGGSLYELLHNSFEVDLSWAQQLKMLEDVAETMTYLHGKSFVHRDLTSLNLMLGEALTKPTDVPMVKVSDLCSARIKDPTEGWAQMTKDVGTLVWSAPEILAQRKYDEKVDLYSFAMVMFEVICREPPFEDLDMVDIVRTVNSGGRPALEAVPPDCPPTLRDLMIACWDHAPERRPPFSKVLAEISNVRAESEKG